MIRDIDLQNINLKDYDVVSFDIFDTLIVRYVDKPENIFKIIEQKVEDAINFKKNRINAEKIVRNKFEREITIEDIYKELGNFYKKELISSLKKLEISLEIDFCTRREDVYGFFKKCIESNKKIIISSDMYLPLEVIKIILEKNNINGYMDLFLSSDTGVCKKDGKLFELIIKKLNIKPSKILHIGDNKNSDCTIPGKLGIKTLLIEKVNVKHIKRWFLKENINSKIIDRFVYFNLQNKKESYTYKIGYKTFGIILYGFSLWLKEELERQKIKKVYFLSRDGWILQKAFNIINFNNKDINDYYLYASRRSLLVPCLHLCKNFAEVKELLNLKSKLTIKSYLNKLGIDFYLDNIEDGVAKVIDEKEQRVLFEKLKGIVVENSEKEYKAITEYLKKKDFNGKLAIVDIGWFGNMQNALYMLTGNEEIFGYYVGTRKNENLDKLEFMKRKGYLFNNKINDNYWYVAAMNSLFETFFLANHGSVKRFNLNKNNDIKIESCGYEYKNNAEKEYLIRDFQRGALDFVKDARKNNIGEWVKLEQSFICNNLVNTFLYPDKKISKIFGDLPFLDDLYGYIARPNSVSFYLGAPRKFISDFRKCQWKVCFISRLFRLYKFVWFDLYYIYKKIK